MKLKPGDTIIVGRRRVNRETFWFLKPAGEFSWRWFGALRKFAQGKKHDMTSIRQSIEKARRDGRR